MSVERGQGEIVCGFIPLTDCATLVVAREFGFAAEEGVDLVLRREASWSNIRDKMALGLFDAAHMLAPMPLAMSLGLSAFAAPIHAPFVLSVNGDVFGVSQALASRISAAQGSVFFDEPRLAADALASAADRRPLRVGVPWLFSMHTVLTDYWLGRCGFDLDREIALNVVPPPFMSEALAAGEIDLFCVGEPWGSAAVESGAGALVLSAASIWSFAPEKVLGVGEPLLRDRPETLAALLRALYRSAEWASRPMHRGAIAEVLSRPEYVDAPAELIERALSGSLIVSGAGEVRNAPRALELFGSAATFPWRSQAAWIAARLVDRHGLDADLAARASDVFRPDVYRSAVSSIAPNLPAASAKLEGAMPQAVEAPGVSGSLRLGPDRFFDESVFDPNQL
ncbi:MAG: ABC transporter substrate-binding protein [Pseudomonadota bacterium]